MFDKVSQVAEQMATNASRREFLGRFGRGAMVVAAALGGVVAFPGAILAARKCSSDSNCPQGKVCRSGRCVDPPVACDDAFSSLACHGLNVGDGCIDGDFIGVCLNGPGCECGVRSKHPHK